MSRGAGSAGGQASLGTDVLQDGANADGKQGLLCVAQKIDDSALGVAEENTFPVGEQMQTGTAR